MLFKNLNHEFPVKILKSFLTSFEFLYVTTKSSKTVKYEENFQKNCFNFLNFQIRTIHPFVNGPKYELGRSN